MSRLQFANIIKSSPTHQWAETFKDIDGYIQYLTDGTDEEKYSDFDLEFNYDLAECEGLKVYSITRDISDDLIIGVLTGATNFEGSLDKSIKPETDFTFSIHQYYMHKYQETLIPLEIYNPRMYCIQNDCNCCS